MKYLIGIVQLSFVITVGTSAYGAKPEGGLFLNLFLAFIFSYWIRLGLSKLVKLGWHGAQSLKLSSRGTAVMTSESSSDLGNRVAFSFAALLVLGGWGFLACRSTLGFALAHGFHFQLLMARD